MLTRILKRVGGINQTHISLMGVAQLNGSSRVRMPDIAGLAGLMSVRRICISRLDVPLPLVSCSMAGIVNAGFAVVRLKLGD